MIDAQVGRLGRCLGCGKQAEAIVQLGATMRDLLRLCIDEGILVVTTDTTGSENLRLNRTHPAVENGLSETAQLR